MPFERPTLPALVTRIRADFRGRLGLAGPLLRRAMTDVVAIVWAGAAHLMHGHLEWIARQLRATTSERDALLEDAAMHGITPVAATYANGILVATGTDATVIPAGAVWVHSNGARYEVQADAAIAAGEADVEVTALGAGDAGNLDDGEELTLETPIAGVDSVATVDIGGLTGGHDVEGTEEVRDRFLLRLREPPTGGSDQDYKAWTLAVAGVSRAWVYRHENGLGTVVVRFMMGEGGDEFPAPADVAAVQAKLDEERPTTAEVAAEAPVPLAVPFTIELTPNTPTVQAAVEAELADLFDREGEPGDGAGRGTILLSEILTTIGITAGVEDFAVTAPVADVVPAVGEKPVVGAITWV